MCVDATGAPRPSVNSKGKRRRPGSKTLAQALKTDDELFVDFIAKCLTWDPDKRLKPQPALRHPWILAGRRRAPPVPSSSTGSTRPPSLVPGRSSRGVSDNMSMSGSPSSREKKSQKSLLISPPTPLMARQNHSHGIPLSAPRMTGGGSALRLANGQVRSSNYMVSHPLLPLCVVVYRNLC
ncbi:hypothetical protein BCR39DRAFT_88840 [Naematelia encephala]|uniref:Protein kinase domain-containing protein n=1 Tax=Naematelia encephala TaxID=71784 RepID=A0A1Y2B9Z6_9TREE|nr:hypothetical protein BCR39DRAFT_88840 [Naematelia encephala]